MRRFPGKPSPHWLGALGVLATTLAGTLGLPRADAAVACRSDPVVRLSNGIKLNLTATLANDTYTDINGITYTLHAPRDTSVVQVVYTSGSVGQLEHLVFYADNAPHDYDVTTYVDTKTTGISVTATTTAVYQSSAGGGNTWASATGSDHQTIATSVVK